MDRYRNGSGVETVRDDLEHGLLTRAHSVVGTEIQLLIQ